jgi:AcrR family transcriptional regulator
VATKAELRDLVVRRWAEATMPPLRAAVALPGTSAQRLRRLFDALIAVKRGRAINDPELFAAYRILSAEARNTIAAHLDDLQTLVTSVVLAGQADGAFRSVDAAAAAQAVIFATSRFHHPAHAGEWNDPTLDAAYESVWRMLMDGLCLPPKPQ